MEKTDKKNVALWSINHLFWASGGPHVPKNYWQISLLLNIDVTEEPPETFSIMGCFIFSELLTLLIRPLAGRFHGTHRQGGFAVREQVWPGPASALLWGNTILYILTFRNIVHDVKVVERCLASTPPRYPGNRLTSAICLPPEAIKKHVGHNDAWGGGGSPPHVPLPTPHPLHAWAYTRPHVI